MKLNSAGFWRIGFRLEHALLVSVIIHAALLAPALPSGKTKPPLNAVPSIPDAYKMRLSARLNEWRAAADDSMSEAQAALPKKTQAPAPEAERKSNPSAVLSTHKASVKTAAPAKEKSESARQNAEAIAAKAVGRSAFYPKESVERGEEGLVIVSISFDSSGRVDGSRVEVSSGFARLDSAALAAAKRLPSMPQLSDDIVQIPVSFNLMAK